MQSPWALRDFRLMQGSTLLITIAIQMQSVAVGWHIYEITRNPLSLGYVGLCIFLPLFLLALVGGHTADRYDRRLILLITNFILICCAAALTFLAHDINPVAPQVWPIYMVLTLFGTVRAFSRPAGSAFLGDVVPAEMLPKAITLSASIWQTGAIIGPAIGGLIYAIFVSAESVYLACTIAFTTSWICTFLVHSRNLKREVRDLSWATLLGGLHYVASRKILLGAMSLDLFAVLLGGAVALLPIYARDILHVGPQGLGLLRSAPSLGAIAMATYLSYRSITKDAGRILFGSVFIFGIGTCIFGISNNMLISLAALFVLGAADMVSVVIRQSLIQINTPSEMRGRVSAVSQVFISASNELGEFESGLTAAWFGVIPATLLGGIGTCLVVLVWIKAFPILYKVNTLHD